VKAAPAPAKKSLKPVIINKRLPMIGRITQLAIKPKVKPITPPKPQIQTTEEQSDEGSTPSTTELLSVGGNET